MRSKLFILGTILLVAFMMVISSCDTSTSPSTSGWGYGTVIVKNLSIYPADDNAYVDICYASDSLNPLAYNVFNRNQQVTFTNVPTGVSLKVWIISDDIYSTSTFSVSSGQTRTFTFNGYAIN